MTAVGRVACATVLLCSLAMHADGQGPRRMSVSRTVPVPQAAVEPHFVVSASRPTHLVGAAMQVVDSDLQRIACHAYASFDGGRAWNVTMLMATGCADPWAAVSPRGTALIAVLGDSGVAVFRSPDGGVSWPSQAHWISGAHDHPLLIADSVGVLFLVSSCAYRTDTRLLRSGICVARSDDDGRSFVSVGRNTFSNLSYEATSAMLVPGRGLLVPYIDHHYWTSQEAVQRKRGWLAFSRDRGASFGEPVLITEDCNRSAPAAWPVLLHGRLGNESRLYWVCERDKAAGIVFHWSLDWGETWKRSAPQLGAQVRRGWTRTPALATDSAGTLLLTWFGGSPGAGTCYHLYAASSLDGGGTFSPATRISEHPSCPSRHGDQSTVQRFPTGGDYIGLQAVAPSRFIVIWSAATSARPFELRVTEIVVTR